MSLQKILGLLVIALVVALGLITKWAYREGTQIKTDHFRRLEEAEKRAEEEQGPVLSQADQNLRAWVSGVGSRLPEWGEREYPSPNGPFKLDRGAFIAMVMHHGKRGKPDEIRAYAAEVAARLREVWAEETDPTRKAWYARELAYYEKGGKKGGK